jgi:hypothetical protein
MSQQWISPASLPSISPERMPSLRQYSIGLLPRVWLHKRRAPQPSRLRSSSVAARQRPASSQARVAAGIGVRIEIRKPPPASRVYPRHPTGRAEVDQAVGAMVLLAPAARVTPWPAPGKGEKSAVRAGHPRLIANPRDGHHRRTAVTSVP